MSALRALRRAALLPALLLPVAHLLAAPPDRAGAAPVPDDPTATPAASAPDIDPSADSSCAAGDLPRTPPSGDALTNAAREVVECLRGAVPGAAPPGGATLRAEGLTVTGLLCGPYPDGVCHARSVVLDEVRITYPGTDRAPGSCTAARRVTFSGQVRFRAAVLSGRVFGLLPLALSTAAVPPVPVPYLRLTDVHATGLWSRAELATTSGTAITPGGCPS